MSYHKFIVIIRSLLDYIKFKIIKYKVYITFIKINKYIILLNNDNKLTFKINFKTKIKVLLH